MALRALLALITNHTSTMFSDECFIIGGTLLGALIGWGVRSLKARVERRAMERDAWKMASTYYRHGGRL